MTSRTSKGICLDCGQIRWLGGCGRRCKPCAYPVGDCTHCHKQAKIYVNGLCYLCYQDQQVRAKIHALEARFVPACEYNRSLFQLYLAYIRRYHLHYHHHRQAKQLMDLLEKEKTPTLRNWSQVYKKAQKHPLTHYPHCSKGQAFLKIGHMLQELGVLPIRREHVQPQIDHLFDQIDSRAKAPVHEYALALEKSRRAPLTIADHLRKLRNLQTWLISQTVRPDLLSVNPQDIRGYLDFLHSCQPGPSYVRQTLKHLDSFYRYCLFNKKVLVNPCQDIPINREQLRLTVCSEYQFKKLTQFVKNPKSNPEQALLLCLILFFGLTLDDITYATLQIESDTLCIVLRRKPRTKGRRYYNREQILKLPSNPKWFIQLQKRFYTCWLKLHSKTKKTYPHPSLVLPKHAHYNRPMGKDFIRKRIYEATSLATGMRIPPRALRQTCGHLHSQNQDASLLSRMGWSPQFAFYYTWLPRKFLPEKSNPPKSNPK